MSDTVYATACKYAEPHSTGGRGRSSARGQGGSRMGLRVNTNVEAFNAHRNLSQTSVGMSQVDGEALQRPAHQPRRRRRRRSGDLRGHARPDPRHGAGQPQRAGRHLARPDGGRLAQRDARDPAARPRALHPVGQRHAVDVGSGQDHGRGRAADRRARPHPRQLEVQRHRALLELRRDQHHHPGRRQRQRGRRGQRQPRRRLDRHDRLHRRSRWTSARSTPR